MGRFVLPEHLIADGFEDPRTLAFGIQILRGHVESPCLMVFTLGDEDGSQAVLYSSALRRQQIIPPTPFELLKRGLSDRIVVNVKVVLCFVYLAVRLLTRRVMTDVVRPGKQRLKPVVAQVLVQLRTATVPESLSLGFTFRAVSPRRKRGRPSRRGI